jgi:hypothetical protein
MNIGELKVDDTIVLKAIAICFKEWLKPEEAHIYTNLGRSGLAKRCQEYGIKPNRNGYYSKKDLDMILSGAPTKYELAARNIKIK